jgi:hypothetical protein
MKRTFCDICNKDLDAKGNIIGGVPNYTYDGKMFLGLNDLCVDCYRKIEHFVDKMKKEGG